MDIEVFEFKLKYKPYIHYDKEGNLRFDPPVYQQRYVAVQQVLQTDIWKDQIKKVIDFGCAELKFFYYLKALENLEHIIEIDIDDALLKEYGPRTQPLNADYLKRRSRPLIVDIYKGDISMQHECLLNADAIVGIEVIEHLFPETLENLPFTIFGYAKPKLVILSTPNCEYNVYFKDLVGFRHDDHKFEWTRKEFQEWAHNLCVRYPDYAVKFIGISPSPEGRDDLGHVSQMAVFIRRDFYASLSTPTVKNLEICDQDDCQVGVVATHSSDFHLNGDSDEVVQVEIVADNVSGSSDDELLEMSEPDIPPEAVPDAKTFENMPANQYTLIYSYLYPMNEDFRTQSQRILDEFRYHLARFQNMEEEFMNEEGCLKIPIEEILRCVYRETDDKEELSKVLLDAGYKIVDDKVVFDRFELDESSDESNRSDTDMNENHEAQIAEDWN